MKKSLRLRAAFAAATVSLFSSVASALPIKEFRKFSKDDQSTYIMAAMSMLAYSYAAGGDLAKGRCVQNWYFGKRGQETPGPHAIALELAAYESIDPLKYHVEGVILGVTDKACDLPTDRD